jgi:hypothetical protein
VINIWDFNISKLYITLRTREDIVLPIFKESALRGGFGSTFKRMVCVHSMEKTCCQCILANKCAFSVIFSPSQNDEGFLKHHIAIPRPFALYINPNKTAFLQQDKIKIEMLLIGKAIEYFPYVFLSLQELGNTGWGKPNAKGERGKFTIEKIEELTEEGSKRIIYEENKKEAGLMPKGFILKNALERQYVQNKCGRFKTVFETPVRMKKDKKIVTYPEFYILIRTVIHRLNSFSYFYGDGNLLKGAAPIIEKAKKVRIIECKTNFEQFPYYSKRQNEKLYLGGLVGEVVYEGNLALFYNYLKSAELLGIGKNTTFGFGRMRLQILGEGGEV